MSTFTADLLRWTLPAIAARWLAPDLPKLLREAYVCPGLEGLERNSLWAQYDANGAQVLLIGRWPRIALVVRPNEPPATFRMCGEASSIVAREDRVAWDDAPAPVREALLAIWGDVVVADSVDGPPSPIRYLGLPALTGRLRAVGGETWDAECLLFCDGEAVGVLVTKPSGIWHDGLVASFEPPPRAVEVAPLNPAVALYEETGWYRNDGGHWVNERARGERGLLRIVSRGCPVLPAGEARLYALRVSAEPWGAEAWHACEFHALADAALAEAQCALNLAHTAVHRAEGGPLPDWRPLMEARERSEAVLAWWEGVEVPPEHREARARVRTGVQACLSVCRSLAASRSPGVDDASIAQAREALRAAQAEVGRLLGTVDARPVARPYGAW